MKHIFLIMGAAGTMLAGCVTSEDPAAGGFGNAMHGLSSGNYQKRIIERENAIAAEQHNVTSLHARAEALRAQRQQLGLEIDRAKVRVTDLNARTIALEVQLKGQQQSRSSEWEKLQSAKARLEDVESQRTRIHAQDTTKPVGDLNDKISAVNAELDALDTMLSAMTGG